MIKIKAAKFPGWNCRFWHSVFHAQIWCYMFVLYWYIPSTVSCYMCKKHFSKPLALFLLSFRTASEIDDKAVEAFVDEDDFIISLDYNDKMGVCSIVLETSSWQMVSEVNGLLFYFAKLEDIIYKLYWLCIFYGSSLLVMSTWRMQYLFLCNDSWL